MKKILCLILLLSSCFIPAISQNPNVQKGDWMVSINFGVGSYIGAEAPSPNQSSYSLSAPTTSWFDKKPILNVEGKWFVSDKWALKLTGGFSFGHNPGYNEVTGTDGEVTEGNIPTYIAVPSSDNIQFFVGTGADYYFKTINSLSLRVGGEIGYAYAIVKTKANSEVYLGKTLGEAYSLKVAPVCGADYFFNENLFVGFDVRPIAYRYSVFSQKPQEGLSLNSSDNHNFSFLAEPMIKLGIKF